VTFVSGLRHRYDQVPPDAVREMRLAFSKGPFFNRRNRGAFPAAPESEQ